MTTEIKAAAALRELHIATNALLYAIDHGIDLDGVMANARKVISDSQLLVIAGDAANDGEPVPESWEPTGAIIDCIEQDGLDGYTMTLSNSNGSARISTFTERFPTKRQAILLAAALQPQ